ncbi:hypothetical protein CEUSTIGMA_g11915.t1 [Chlamydomonas eustigma]|uniref:Uncharacterized protein n=1 Tax=Chlamydomonas eustigma TaxID=1157962 RepID=A0A250XN36_9CHLO|nr:hypothetical protein CEUSTIGMA_g11915.t1 [Chlamydomonas eustigma]|eukprot:GAX84495.1 hypothetical protein CEUSTIGMA_g11915.t1 [Chlamydomonas eustigma]
MSTVVVFDIETDRLLGDGVSVRDSRATVLACCHLDEDTSSPRSYFADVPEDCDAFGRELDSAGTLIAYNGRGCVVPEAPRPLRGDPGPDRRVGQPGHPACVEREAAQDGGRRAGGPVVVGRTPGPRRALLPRRRRLARGAVEDGATRVPGGEAAERPVGRAGLVSILLPAEVDDPSRVRVAVLAVDPQDGYVAFGHEALVRGLKALEVRELDAALGRSTADGDSLRARVRRDVQVNDRRRLRDGLGVAQETVVVLVRVPRGVVPGQHRPPEDVVIRMSAALREDRRELQGPRGADGLQRDLDARHQGEHLEREPVPGRIGVQRVQHALATRQHRGLPQLDGLLDEEDAVLPPQQLGDAVQQCRLPRPDVALQGYQEHLWFICFSPWVYTGSVATRRLRRPEQ